MVETLNCLSGDSCNGGSDVLFLVQSRAGFLAGVTSGSLFFAGLLLPGWQSDKAGAAEAIVTDQIISGLLLNNAIPAAN